MSNAISEPVPGGEYSEIQRLFHEEELVEEAIFKSRLRFPDIAAFEEKFIGATHTRHHLTPMRANMLRKPESPSPPCGH